MSTDQILQLQQPVVTDGAIRAVNYFNGRLLTGNDLSRQQEARRAADRHLGLAQGSGVAFGFEVGVDPAQTTDNAPVLLIRAGLAINRLGETLRLDTDSSVALTRRFETSAADRLFDHCDPIGGGTYVAGAGVYVLTLAPARRTEGRAETNGLDPESVRCNVDATVEAVQFRLLAVASSHYSDLDLGSDRFRNRLAYRFFGIQALETDLERPLLDEPDEIGLIADLQNEGLSDSEVPLALIYWTAGGLRFIDQWAVRRMLHQPRHQPTDRLRNPVTRRALTDAMCAQFAEHLSALIQTSGNAATLVAQTHFRYLPPFGIAPLSSSTRAGVDELGFFSGLIRRPRPFSTTRRVFVDARQLGSLREQALAHAPLDTDANELIWVYRPWQNAQAASTDPSVQAAVVFTSGLMPNHALPRLDLARVDYSNLANCCDPS